MTHTYVISELGGCAEGDLPTMLRQIDAAAAAGCDAVKAQWVSLPSQLAERRHAQDYLGAYSNISYPLAWLPTLHAYAHAQGMDFGCSVYLPEDVPLVSPSVDFVKVSSFECQDRELICAIPPMRRLIVSTGMCDDEAVAGVYKARRDGKLDVLHCVSAYPCPIRACNLGVLQSGYYDGFSDHTANVLAGAFAVCAGARIVEFHLRLESTSPANPDYACALDPIDAREYVRLIRLAESAMGDGAKQAQLVEADMLAYRVTP